MSDTTKTCIKCGSAGPFYNGDYSCKKCRNKFHLKHSKKRVASGLCRQCDMPRVNKNHCEKHRRLNAEAALAYYKRKRDATQPPSTTH